MAKVFVNCVDQFSGKNISQVFTQSIVGGTLGEAQDDEEGSEIEGTGSLKPHYHVVGTLKDSEALKPDWVDEIVPNSNRDDLLEMLMTCDVIVYDINQDLDEVDEAGWAVEALHSQLDVIKEQKIFICLSTIMTWARSKPLDPEDPDIPFTEDDYRKRRPHPNFKHHIAVEKQVIKLGKTNKSKFCSYVIASGLAYGCGENIFHFLFKSAWLGEVDALNVFGNGQNVIPMIHIRDLACVLLNVADGKPKTRYLVAVDSGQLSLEEVVKNISTNLGTGKVKFIPREEALLDKDLSQKDFDHLLVNLRMEGTYVKENMQIEWVSEMGMVENIDVVIREFKDTRGLLPVRICVLGPPAAGKTTLAEKLCRHFKIHHVKVMDVIRETIQQLERSAARADTEDLDEDDDAQAQKDKEYLELLRESQENNDGRYEDQYMINFFRKKLKSMPCQNQGFVLDGYPKTYEQAKDLFANEDEEEEEGEGQSPEYDKTIMPELVVALDSSDDFLKERIMNLPETEVEGTHNSEAEFLRRLSLYRDLNTEDNTVLNYFDELEIHPETFEIPATQCEVMLKKIKKEIGEPRNYGPTPEELAEMQRKATEERLQREAKEKEERERQEVAEAAETQRKRSEWQGRFEEVKAEEREMLETQSYPLRNYLLKNVMPTLTQGLIEVCKVRPDDPVDFLAEYLFENNPQID
ncbi:adenylate kinase 7-like isoform X2 [Oscarella lobularis]|uniref:adenylate kinase 7-like isoform X2 n=1 Tax=Oscarella lobularis TaxID=121494 RepID=UPI00331409F2